MGDQKPKQRRTSEADEKHGPDDQLTGMEKDDIEGDEQKGTNDEEASGRTETGATSRGDATDTDDTGAQCCANYRNPCTPLPRGPLFSKLGGTNPVIKPREGKVLPRTR